MVILTPQEPGTMSTMSTVSTTTEALSANTQAQTTPHDATTVAVTAMGPGLGNARIAGAQTPEHRCSHCGDDCGWAYGRGAAIPGCRFRARDPMYFN